MWGATGPRCLTEAGRWGRGCRPGAESWVPPLAAEAGGCILEAGYFQGCTAQPRAGQRLTPTGSGVQLGRGWGSAAARCPGVSCPGPPALGAQGRRGAAGRAPPPPAPSPAVCPGVPRGSVPRLRRGAAGHRCPGLVGRGQPAGECHPGGVPMAGVARGWGQHWCRHSDHTTALGWGHGGACVQFFNHILLMESGDSYKSSLFPKRQWVFGVAAMVAGHRDAPPRGCRAPRDCGVGRRPLGMSRASPPAAQRAQPCARLLLNANTASGGLVCPATDMRPLSLKWFSSKELLKKALLSSAK